MAQQTILVQQILLRSSYSRLPNETKTYTRIVRKKTFIFPLGRTCTFYIQLYRVTFPPSHFCKKQNYTLSRSVFWGLFHAKMLLLPQYGGQIWENTRHWHNKDLHCIVLLSFTTLNAKADSDTFVQQCNYLFSPDWSTF